MEKSRRNIGGGTSVKRRANAPTYYNNFANREKRHKHVRIQKNFSSSLAKVTLYSKADVALNFQPDQCQLPIPILLYSHDHFFSLQTEVRQMLLLHRVFSESLHG